MNQKSLVMILVVFIVVILAAAVYVVSPEIFQGLKTGGGVVNLPPEKPKVIEEKLVIPETEKITGGEGRTVDQGPVEVPLVPKTESEKVVVSKAVLTVKGSYDLAVLEANKWASDASLIFIKSLGAVTLEGKSSQWQLAFSSKTKSSKGYEIIIQGDQIVSKKEIDSAASGADLPSVWRDSGEVIISLQELPQFSTATVSTINLYYNTDGKLWRYVLSTSRGNTSMSAE
ncbi:MAG: hypothetical protein Q8N37_04890 [bacterium]|nr:hypothetical protein [bacterium]